MVKLVNTTVLSAVSCRFESYWGYKIKVAKLVDAKLISDRFTAKQSAIAIKK